jgi:3',5'-cyclic AMP phosphodiesterase CpdA
MRIVQLSDLHVKSNRAFAFNAVDSATALEKTVAHLAAMRPVPDCVVISGDLAEHGEAGAYELVARALAGLAAPVYVAPGNHDDGENLRRILGAYCPADPETAPYICYTASCGPARLVVIDSSQPGSHSGYLHEPVARWLEKTLAADRDRPTLVFAHHPPFLSGLGVMDEPFARPEELARILRASPGARYCCGHLHRGAATVWEGIPAMVCPPVAMHIELDLSPRGGDTFTLGPPEYLLHHVYDGRVNTHFCQVPGTFPHGGPYSFSNPPRPAAAP